MDSVTKTAGDLWSSVSEILQKHDAECFDRWYGNLRPLAVENDTLVLAAPDRFFARCVGKNHSLPIVHALGELSSHIRSVEVRADDSTQTAHGDSSAATGLPLPDAPAQTERPALPNIHQPTFENFVRTEENRCSYMAARTAAEAPGVYNPLYIYGGSGVGKSHLLHAIENYLKRTSPETRVRYVACSDLLNEYYDLLVNKKDLRELRLSMRDVDVLLVDDVHNLANKNVLQEEVFGVFNALFSRHKQIVFTSDRQPCEIEGLQARLVTRFESGVTTELAVPEYEGRLAILRQMRNDQFSAVRLTDDILDFLASRISSSVRRLKGAFMRLTAFVSMSHKARLSIEEATRLLSAQIEQERKTRTFTIEEIQRLTAEHFALRLTDLLSDRRPKNIAQPRMVAMYLCRKYTTLSLTEIGDAFGKNHATILNAMKKVPEICGKDESMKLSLMHLERKLH